MAAALRGLIARLAAEGCGIRDDSDRCGVYAFLASRVGFLIFRAPGAVAAAVADRFDKERRPNRASQF